MAPVNARKSLDPRWTRHHTAPASGFHTAEIVVMRRTPVLKGVEPVYNQQTKQYEGVEAKQVFAGKARLQPFGILGDQNVGQDPTARRLMRVQIKEIDTGIAMDDMLYVVDCPDSPELVDYQLEVRGAITSSNPWLTDLVCEADAKRLL